jgi:hypothetical protein
VIFLREHNRKGLEQRPSYPRGIQYAAEWIEAGEWAYRPRRPQPKEAVVARLDRAIQYAAASQFHHQRLWNTGSPGQAGR